MFIDIVKAEKYIPRNRASDGRLSCHIACCRHERFVARNIVVIAYGDGHVKLKLCIYSLWSLGSGNKTSWRNVSGSVRLPVNFSPSMDTTLLRYARSPGVPTSA